MKQSQNLRVAHIPEGCDSLVVLENTAATTGRFKVFNRQGNVVRPLSRRYDTVEQAITDLRARIEWQRSGDAGKNMRA